jgi:hypothetical protein
MKLIENILRDSWIESPDATDAMSVNNEISCERLHTALSLVLFVACTANMALLCALL